MKRKIVKTINYKEYEVYENGHLKLVGEKNTTETVEFDGTYFEEEQMIRASKYSKK